MNCDDQEKMKPLESIPLRLEWHNLNFLKFNLLDIRIDDICPKIPHGSSFILLNII